MICGVLMVALLVYLVCNIIVCFLWLWSFYESDHGTPGVAMPTAQGCGDPVESAVLVAAWIMFNAVAVSCVALLMQQKRESRSWQGEEPSERTPLVLTKEV